MAAPDTAATTTTTTTTADRDETPPATVNVNVTPETWTPTASSATDAAEPGVVSRTAPQIASST